MRTYIVTFEDGTELPVTAPSVALLRRLCVESGWTVAYGDITYID